MTPEETRSQPDHALPTGSLPPSPDPLASTRSRGAASDLDVTQTKGDTRPGQPAEAVVPPGYTITRELGRGGMGVVYAATDNRLKREVAIKMLLRGGDERQLIRFLIEAEAMAQVRHPNVVQVFEAGEQDGHPFLALEHLSGGTLSDRLKTGRLPVRESLRLVLKIARGVEAAHRQGIVHRDLKPGNVMFDAAGEPKVTDFGLAKHGTKDLTATDATMGTPAYMAPEQAKGETKTAGPAADVFSLGVMLYELTTGVRPFAGEKTAAVVYKVIHEAPEPPRRRDPALPRDVEIITLKCLDKDPSRRYADAGKLADDLERLLNGEPITARPVSRSERVVMLARRNPAVTASLLAALTAMSLGTAVSYLKFRQAKTQEGIAVEKATEAEAARNAQAALVAERDSALLELADQVRRRDQALEVIREREAELRHHYGNSNMALANAAYHHRDMVLCRELLNKVPEEHRGFEWGYRKRQASGGLFTLHGHRDAVSSVACSPDGRRIATGSADGTAKIWNARTGLESLTLRGHAGGVTSVAFSPDGRRIATGSADKTAGVWDARTGKLLFDLRGHAGEVTGVCFSPDGTRLATASGDNTVRTWDAGSGRALLNLKGPFDALAGMCFSPDGRRLLLKGLQTPVGLWDAWSGAPALEFPQLDVTVTGMAFSPDGTRIVARNFGRHDVWDAGSALPLVKFKQPNRIYEYDKAAFSPDGTRIVSGGPAHTATVWDARRGDPLLELKGHSDSITGVCFSPDGQRIITASADATAKIWSVQPGESTPFSPEADPPGGFLELSPDATRLVNHADGGTAAVWDTKTGRGVADLRGHAFPGVYCARFSPDGSRIFTGGYDGTARIWDAESGEPLVKIDVQAGSAICVAVSPDGARMVTCGGHEQSKGTIRDARTGLPVRELKGNLGLVFEVRYSPDGSKIVTAGNYGVALWRADTGEPAKVPEDASIPATTTCFSPDGTRLVVGGGDKATRVWDTRTGRTVLVLKGHVHRLCSVDYSPDGSRILTCDFGSVMKVWDAKTGFQTLEFTPPPPERIEHARFSRDGSRVFTGGSTLRIWDGRFDPSGRLFDLNSGRPGNASFSGNGSLVVTGSSDGMVAVWDAETSRQIWSAHGHAKKVIGVGFSQDDGVAVSYGADHTAVVWDAKTGAVLREKLIPEDVFVRDTSPDGKFHATAEPGGLRMVPTGGELEHRLIQTRPDEWGFFETLGRATGDQDSFASNVLLDRLLSIRPWDAELYQERIENADDPILTARTTFHQPLLDETGYDRALVRHMAVAGHRLAKRLVAQESLREGNPALAIPLLIETMLRRPPDSPPVEELLIAKAYLALNDRAQAERYYRAAADWLDRPKNPMRAAEVVTKSAVNGWAALGEAFKPIDDPRHNTFDWESWHECDVFRADVERALAGR